jgi:hypothetical protein
VFLHHTRANECCQLAGHAARITETFGNSFPIRFNPKFSAKALLRFRVRASPRPVPLTDSLLLNQRGELLVTEGDYRVHAHSAARWKETRHSGHHNEQQHDARKC